MKNKMHNHNRTNCYIGTFPNTPEGVRKYRQQWGLIKKGALILASQYPKKIMGDDMRIEPYKMFRQGTRRHASNSTLAKGAKTFDAYFRIRKTYSLGFKWAI